MPFLKQRNIFQVITVCHLKLPNYSHTIVEAVVLEVLWLYHLLQFEMNEEYHYVHLTFQKEYSDSMLMRSFSWKWHKCHCLHLIVVAFSVWDKGHKWDRLCVGSLDCERLFLEISLFCLMRLIRGKFVNVLHIKN